MLLHNLWLPQLQLLHLHSNPQEEEKREAREGTIFFLRMLCNTCACQFCFPHMGLLFLSWTGCLRVKSLFGAAMYPEETGGLCYWGRRAGWILRDPWQSPALTDQALQVPGFCTTRKQARHFIEGRNRSAWLDATERARRMRVDKAQFEKM